MKIVNVQYAKTQLSRLLEEAAAGETIVIGKAGKPMAMLVAWKPALGKRQLGGVLENRERNESIGLFAGRLTR